MDFIGIDLHKTSSQVCILSGDGELTERRIKSTRDSFDEVFADRPPARILVEASTESEWVAQHLEGLGPRNSGGGGGSLSFLDTFPLGNCALKFSITARARVLLFYLL